jgi:rod shape-determining protein MreC
MSAHRRRVSLTIALLAASLGVLLMGRAGLLAPMEDLAQRSMTGLQGAVSSTFFNIRDFVTAPRNMQDLLAQNSLQAARIAQLEAEVVALREQAAQVDVLQALLGVARQQPENRYLVAHVIGRDTSPFLHYLILDQGSDAGIRFGMPVVSQFGLVGRIQEVTTSASKVQLIIDPGSSINARVVERRAEGIVVGRATGDLEMDYLPQNIAVAPGDNVVTSGLGGMFPAEILIGRVVSVHKRDYELYQTAVIEPRNDFSVLEMLLVITNFQPVVVGPLSQPAS